MERIKNELLKKHTTFKIGGPAEILSIPNNEKELLDEVKFCIDKNIPFKILGNGSNVLVRDKGISGRVIKNLKALNFIKKKDHYVIVGSSVMLPRFVKFCVENDLEGMEYLYSIPGTIGGALYMNAGRGKIYNQTISDKLISVRVFDGNKIIEIYKEEINFSYRRTIFQENKGWIIVSAKFKLAHQNKKIGNKKIKDRMDLVNKIQLRNYPNAGSIFKKKSHKALKCINNLKVGGAQIRGNWIINTGDASSSDVLWLIRISKMLHFFFLSNAILEIEIW